MNSLLTDSEGMGQDCFFKMGSDILYCTSFGVFVTSASAQLSFDFKYK